MTDKTNDRLFSKIIISKGVCEICGATENLVPHHYYNKKNKSVRWFIPNGCCLCFRCHTASDYSAHLAPDWFKSRILRIRGGKWLELLTEKKNEVWDGDKDKINKYLHERE